MNESSEQSAAASETLQFDKAEMPVALAAGSVACANCRRSITSTYYQIANIHVCPACREGVFRMLESAGHFGRAALFGLGAAIVGAFVWYGIRRATGYEIGLVAIFIGIIVGMAVRKGSMSLGGRKYQVLAVVLTYVSITMANIPDILAAFKQNAESSASTAASSGEPTALGFVIALGLLFVLALVSPFLAGVSNILGLIIIGFGLYQAWKINTRQDLTIQGPFTVAASESQPTSNEPEANSSESTQTETSASG